MDKIKMIKIIRNPYLGSSKKYEIWEQGAQAVMNLQLSPLFAEWVNEGYWTHLDNWDEFNKMTWVDKFNFWLENIYTPETV